MHSIFDVPQFTAFIIDSSASAFMHPALAIPEIVEAVFAQVVVSRIHRSPDAAERDLASAARSCRQFSGPALDRLWSQMATLKPLLDLLDGFREEEGVCILRGQVHRNEWTRLTQYSARIRTLYYTNDRQRSPKIDASVFIQLGRFSRGEPLFPRLQALHFTASWLPVPELLLFQSESLLELNFACELPGNMDYALASYFTSMPDACRLRSLSFAGRTSHLSIASLPRFPLQRLSISRMPWNIDCKTLDVIGKLEHLVDLHLDLIRVDFAELKPSTDIPLALETLSLSGSLENMTTFMQKFSVSARTLYSITFNHTSMGLIADAHFPSFTDAWHTLLLASATRYAPSLRRLTIGVLVVPASPDLSVPGHHLLAPLLACPHMEHFLMVGFPPIALTDADLARLAAAWPALISCILPASPANAAPSAAGLHAFALRCPKLVELTASVHTRDADAQLRDLAPVLSSQRTAVEPVSHPHQLRTLTIDSQPVGSLLVDVLALLLAIFPQLEFIGEENVSGMAWGEVNQLLNESRARRTGGSV